MIGRWRKSRTWRKFTRNRMAIAALIVVGIYFFTGFIVLCGALTVDDTLRRYGSDSLPGLYRKPTNEYRVLNVSIKVDQFERALGKRTEQEVEAGLEEIEFGYYRAANKDPDELRTIVESCYTMIGEFDDVEDLDVRPDLVPDIEALEKESQKLFGELGETERLFQNLVLIAGTDRQGRSILIRGIYSIKVAMQIGVVTSLISVCFGSILGAAAGYFRGWVDHLVIWLYSTISSIPNLVLLVLLAYMFTGSKFDNTLVPVYVAFCATFWIGPCRVIRGETLKLKELEYVQAATTIGFGSFRILLRHIMPNTAHLMLINFSLLLIGAIKSEVILSFLGLGVKRGASWGNMIFESKQEVINGFFWQIGTATMLMFALVLAFNILSDALQDVFDPKHN